MSSKENIIVTDGEVQTDHASAESLSAGLIDIHSHMLVGVDDGCQSLDETLASVAQLKERGFVATICTPHIWAPLFPKNTPAAIATWVRQLQDILDRHEMDYRLYAGGEVRIYDKLIPWMKQHGVPTLADSNCVLVDYWGDAWDDHIDRTCDWLFEQGYQPVLAHPERINVHRHFDKHLDKLTDQGVWLQGNFKCFSGAEGPLADERARRLLSEGRYTFLAMDMHRPDDLPPRFEGMDAIVQDFGQTTLDQLCDTRQRELILK